MNHLWSLLPLGLLLLPALLPRNRSRGAAAVWFPVLALYFCWLPFARTSGGVEGGLEMAAGVFAVGLGVTCSLLPWIATGGRWRTWGLSLSVALSVEGLAFACFSTGSLAFFASWSASLIWPASATVILITSMVLATRAGRGRAGALRFLVWLLLWLTICSLALVFAVVLAQGVLAGTWDEFGLMGFIYLFSVLFLGLACVVGVAPFLLLGTFSETYRERFRAALSRE